MAQERYVPLVGKMVRLDGASGPFRVCRHCGGVAARIVIGVGPHLGGLRCCECDMHLSWIGRSHMDALLSRLGSDAA